jgi:hypothetical protein
MFVARFAAVFCHFCGGLVLLVDSALTAARPETITKKFVGSFRCLAQRKSRHIKFCEFVGPFNRLLNGILGSLAKRETLFADRASIFVRENREITLPPTSDTLYIAQNSRVSLSQQEVLDLASSFHQRYYT